MFNIYKRNYNINCLVHGNTNENVYEGYISKLSAYYVDDNKRHIALFDENLNTIIEINLKDSCVIVFNTDLSFHLEERKCEYLFRNTVQQVFDKHLKNDIKTTYLHTQLSSIDA